MVDMKRDVNNNVYFRAFYNRYSLYEDKEKIEEKLTKFSNEELKKGLYILNKNSLKPKREREIYTFSSIIQEIQNNKVVA